MDLNNNLNKCNSECGFFQNGFYKTCGKCNIKNSKRKTDDIDDIDISQKKRKTDRINCKLCHKKLGLTAIQCKCIYYFCSKHRYPEEHNCTIDYKALGKEILKKNIINCTAEKINII